MNATTRRATGSFPATPAVTNFPRRAPFPGRNRANIAPRNNPLPPAPEFSPAQPSGTVPPVIPLNILDAPTQRFYAAAIYGALMAWKFYDWVGLMEDENAAGWLFLKWVFIEFIFLFGLPEMRIPWLELSQTTSIVLFCSHALFDFVMMFNIGVCHRTP